MKKKAISLMLVTAFLANSGILTNAATINSNEEATTSLAKAAEEVKTTTLEIQKSADIKNISTEAVTIGEDLSGYYGRTVDIVFYNAEGAITKYEHNYTGDIKLGAGERARITVSGANAITLKVNLADSEKILIENLQDDVKTLYRLTMETGKNYKMKNDNNFEFDVSTNGSGYYERYYDVVHYNAQSAIDSFQHNSSDGSIKLKQGEAVEISNSSKNATDIWFPTDYKTNVTLQDSETPALYILNVEKGKNYSIKNSNDIPVNVRSDASGYYGRKYDFVKYNSFSQIDSFDYKSTSGSLSLGAGERARITNEDDKTIQFWFPQSLKSKFVVEEDQKAALFVNKLCSGKNYIIKNDNEANIKLSTDGSAYYNRKIDLVKYDALSNIKDFSSNDSTSTLEFAEGESYRVTPGVNGMTTWLPSDYQDKFTISEIQNKALEYYSVEAGKSVTVTNNSDAKKDLKTNLSSYNNIRVDYVSYDKDGKVLNYNMDSTDGISIGAGCKYDITSTTETPFRFWIPSEFKENVIMQPKAENTITEYKLKPGKAMSITNNGEVDANIKASGNLEYLLADGTDTGKTIRNANLKSKDSLNLQNKRAESVSIYIPTSQLNNLDLGGEYSPVSVEGVKLVKNSDDILVGGTSNFGTYIAPTRATNKNVTWKSSNEKIATVDKDGKITGVSIGQATITAVTEDGQKEASGIINVVYKDKDGNQIGEVQIIKEGQNAKAPEAPKIDGLEFVGWSASSDKISSDLVITPIYEDPNAEKYTVTFKVDGQVYGNAQTVIKGQGAVKPQDPVKDGYTFKGWDKAFDNVTGNLEVNAKFDKNPDNPPSGDNNNLFNFMGILTFAGATLAGHLKRKKQN